MRVLVVAQQLRRAVPGGIGTYVHGLLQGLRTRAEGGINGGVDVTLWASRPPRGRPDPLAAEAPVLASPLPGPLLTRAWDRGRAGCPPGLDVLHAMSLALPPPRGTPATVMVHDVAWRQVPEAYPRRGRRWHEAALARALARADLLMVPSVPSADALLAAGADPDRVEVVELGCDHLPPPDNAAADELLAGLNVVGEYLLTVSTVEPRKNLPRLLAAYRAARPRLPEPWPLLVVGPVGWGERLPPEPGAVLTGAVSGATLAALYARSRLVAYVPLLEGFGLPVVEAMHACVPVVASAMPSAGGAAVEVDPLDVAGIADALVRVATDDVVRAERVTAGLLRSGELTWEACARGHVELWRSVARSNPDRP